MFKDKSFRKMEYEELNGNCNSVGVKSNRLSPSLECENVIEVFSADQRYQSENENHLRMIASRDQALFSCSERWKAFVAFLFLCFGFTAATISLALTHDRLPDRKVYGPLPDVVLNNVQNIDFFLNVAEIQIIVAVNVCVILIFFHKHRLVIAKRASFILGILYLYRSVCFYVTVLPISSRDYYCAPQSNKTSAVNVIERAMSLITGMGLSINNKQVLCGDSIFSGHATILFFCYLVIYEYSPKKLKYLHILALLNAVTGTIFLLISHAHYTIDVIIAYYITTRTFWAYHSLCHNSSTHKNHLTKEWWMSAHRYLEEHTGRVSITNEFEMPCRISFKQHANKV